MSNFLIVDHKNLLYFRPRFYCVHMVAIQVCTIQCQAFIALLIETPQVVDRLCLVTLWLIFKLSNFPVWRSLSGYEIYTHHCFKPGKTIHGSLNFIREKTEWSLPHTVCTVLYIIILASYCVYSTVYRSDMIQYMQHTIYTVYDAFHFTNYLDENGLTPYCQKLLCNKG